MKNTITTALALLAASALAAPLSAQAPDWSKVDAAIGRTGAPQAGGVQRYSFPRADLKVTIGDVTVKPALALGSWTAFLPMGSSALVMGDLVLTDAEVPLVTSALQQNGIEQTAIHHHIVGETPRVYYMHIHAHGDPVAIARGVRAALSQTATPNVQTAAPPPLELDSAGIRGILGYAGRANGGVYQVSVPRAEKIRSTGMEIPASMGLGTAINFQPTGSGRAAITGDFVLVSSEVNRVIKTLREGNIVVTALHNHLLDEEPRLFFMHFWGNADALALARTLRKALDQTYSAR